MLEIEKKFIIEERTLKFLKENAESLGVKEMTDIYLDDKNATLMTMDFWLRIRNDVYQLKFAHPKNSKTVDFYNEIEGKKQVQNKLSSLENPLLIDDLTPFCELYSTRKRFTLNGCTIDVDEVSSPDGFHYLIAEVEKLVENDSQIKAANQAIADTAEILQINKFVRNGKVFEYLQQYRPKLFKIAKQLHS